MKEKIATNDAPFSHSPISQAIRAGDFVFTAGQGPVHPETKIIEETHIEGQTRQVLSNLQSILGAAGSKLSEVVKVNVYLRRITDFAGFDSVYREFFQLEQEWPARLTVEAVLGRAEEGMDIEIDMVAYSPGRGG